MRGDTHSIGFSVMNAHAGSNAILPTFSAPLIKTNGGKYNVRNLYDPASQITFIAECLLKFIEHKVIKEDVQIRISCFNESRQITTKIVEFSLPVLTEFRLVRAVVVPEIKSRISVSSLTNICEAFKSHSIPLADKKFCLLYTSDAADE